MQAIFKRENTPKIIFTDAGPRLAVNGTDWPVKSELLYPPTPLPTTPATANEPSGSSKPSTKKDRYVNAVVPGPSIEIETCADKVTDEQLQVSADAIEDFMRDFVNNIAPEFLSSTPIKLEDEEVTLWHELLNIAVALARQLFKHITFFHAFFKPEGFVRQLFDVIQVILHQDIHLAQHPGAYFLGVSDLRTAITFIQDCSKMFLDTITDSWLTHKPADSEKPTEPRTPKLPFEEVDVLTRVAVTIPPMKRDAYMRYFRAYHMTRGTPGMADMVAVGIGGHYLDIYAIHAEVLLAGSSFYLNTHDAWSQVLKRLLSIPSTWPAPSKSAAEEASTVAGLRQFYSKYMERCDNIYVAAFIRNKKAKGGIPRQQSRLRHPCANMRKPTMHDEIEAEREVAAILAAINDRLDQRLAAMPACTIPAGDLPQWKELFGIATAAVPDVENHFPVFITMFHDQVLVGRLNAFAKMIRYQTDLLRQVPEQYVITVNLLKAIVETFRSTMTTLRRALAEERELDRAEEQTEQPIVPKSEPGA